MAGKRDPSGEVKAEDASPEEVCEALAFGTRLLVRSDHASQSAADQMARQLVGELVFATKVCVAEKGRHQPCPP